MTGLEWELFVVVWSPEQGLLYINGSQNMGDYRALAKAIAGDDVMLVHGDQVFRSFAGVNRLRLQNVGLTEQLGRHVRYTGRMGSDVEPALPMPQRQRAQRSVLAGIGFEDGKKGSIGASRKGRIWSHRRPYVAELVIWCKAIGARLVDNSIDASLVLSGAIQATVVTTRPTKMPFAIDWPEDVYTTVESLWTLDFDGTEIGLWEVEIELVDPSTDGRLLFRVVSEAISSVFELRLFDRDGIPNYEILLVDGAGLQIVRGSRKTAASEFFYFRPPTVWFSDGSSLEGNQYVELKRTGPPFDRSRIEVWDWQGTNLRKESQRAGKRSDSIQYATISRLKTSHYEVIVDDDRSGEAADVVTIELENSGSQQRIRVGLYHCKYSSSKSPGARITDLYEVCGQAQKSVAWCSSPEKKLDLFTHLLRGASAQEEQDGVSRYEVGSRSKLLAIRDLSRQLPVEIDIFVVQPGMSRKAASPQQLELLAVVDTYLKETYQIRFGVIGSD